MTPRSAFLPILLGSTLLLAPSACSKSADKPASADAPSSSEITSEIKPEEWKDLVFTIEKQDVATDGSRTLQVRGTHNGAEVGLIILLGPKWEAHAPDPKSSFAFHSGTLEIHSLGPTSNTLLTALDELYGTKLQPKGMRPETKFAAISLEGNPADLGKGEVKIKTFFESEDESRYAELYTNIDLPKRKLRLCEKDPEYRAAIIKALQSD